MLLHLMQILGENKLEMDFWKPPTDNKYFSELYCSIKQHHLT